MIDLILSSKVLKAPILVILFFIVPVFVHSAHVVSVADSLRLKEIIAMKDSGNYFCSNRNLDKAMQKYTEVVQLARESGFKTQEALGYCGIGLVYYSKGEYVQSHINYAKALELARQTNDTLTLAKILMNTAINYKRQGLYEKAMPLLIESIRYSESMKNRHMVLSELNTMANIQNDIGQYHEALKLHFKILAMREELKDSATIPTTLNNICLAYQCLDSLDQALRYAQKSMEYPQRINDKEGYTSSIINIGIIEMKKGNLKEAEKRFLESYRIKVEINDQNGIASVSNELGKLYIRKGMLHEAEKFLEKGQVLSLKNQSLEREMDNAKLRAELYTKTGALQKALNAFSEYDSLKEQILGSQQTKTINDLKLRYETEKNELEIENLKKINQAQVNTIKMKERLQYALAFGMAMFLGISLLAYTSYQRKKRDNLKITTLMQERQHRTKNNLQLVTGLLSLQSEQSELQQVKGAIRSGETRMQAVALLDKLLYENPNNLEIDMDEYIRRLTSNLVSVFGDMQNPVNVVFNVQPICLDASKATPLGLILNELVTNSFKYAFPENPKPGLEIGFFTDPSGKCHLLYSDNGPGLKNGNEFSKAGSLGLKLIRSLSGQLKGETETSSENGFCFRLTFQSTKKARH